MILEKVSNNSILIFSSNIVHISYQKIIQAKKSCYVKIKMVTESEVRWIKFLYFCIDIKTARLPPVKWNLSKRNSKAIFITLKISLISTDYQKKIQSFLVKMCFTLCCKWAPKFSFVQTNLWLISTLVSLV